VFIQDAFWYYFGDALMVSHSIQLSLAFKISPDV